MWRKLCGELPADVEFVPIWGEIGLYGAKIRFFLIGKFRTFAPRMIRKQMADSHKSYIPEFLRGKYQLIGTVTFAVLFSVLFLLVSLPFSNNAWFRLGHSMFFTFTVLFALGAVAIIIVSRVVMYKTRGLFRMRYWQYILWCNTEIFVIALLYTVFTVTLARPEDQTTVEIFLRALVYGFIALAVPYVIAGMFFTIINQDRTIRLLNMQDVVTDETSPKLAAAQKITLFDNAGALKLSVSRENLCYVESDDNYIKVWYTDNRGALKTYMLRCRLKTVEESFLGSSLVRCHRKFIVNMDKVTALHKEKDNYFLDLANGQIPPIPVTRTYAANVLRIFAEK